MADDLWRTTADEYEMTDDDVDYILHAMAEDGDLDALPEQTVEEARAEVAWILAAIRVHEEDEHDN